MVNLFSFYDNRQCTDVVIDSFHITSFSFNFLFAFGLIWLAMLHHLICYTFCVVSPMQLQLHLNFVVINHATKLFCRIHVILQRVTRHYLLYYAAVVDTLIDNLECEYIARYNIKSQLHQQHVI